jgi:regulator of protease activity HflC (stomatin/prohibitin superfamily)
MGALVNANIFGTIAVIAQTINRKAQRFQEQIDVANTSMKNMKLPESLQNSIREFMMFT